MLIDGLLIEHQCRPRAVAAAGTSGTIVYLRPFLWSLLADPMQCLSVPIVQRWKGTVWGDTTKLSVDCGGQTAEYTLKRIS